MCMRDQTYQIFQHFKGARLASFSLNVREIKTEPKLPPSIMEHNLNQMHPFTAKEQKLAQRTNPIKPTAVEIYIIITRQKI